MIWGGGGEGGGGGLVCCFIFHDSVQDCSSMGCSYNLMIFWPKISMLGSAEQTRYPKIIDNACDIFFCFSKVS